LATAPTALAGIAGVRVSIAGTSSENLRHRELDNFEQLCALQHAGDLHSQSPVDLIATIEAPIPAFQAASAPDPAIAAKINRQNRQQDG
jgi:hypothetical protein